MLKEAHASDAFWFFKIIFLELRKVWLTLVIIFKRLSHYMGSHEFCKVPAAFPNRLRALLLSILLNILQFNQVVPDWDLTY